jgi:hypothetical protein
MPRLARRWQWTDAACYHVLDRGHNRALIFADDKDRACFLGLLARYRDLCACALCPRLNGRIHGP